MAAVRDDLRHPYTDVRSPMHEYAIADMQRLHASAFPEPSAEGTAPQAPPEPTEGTGLSFALPDLPEGMTWNAPALSEFAQGAGEFGVSATEVEHWLGRYAQSWSQPLPDPEASIAALKEEWAGAYDSNLQAARLFVGRLPQMVQDDLDATGLGDDPALIRRCAELGRPLLEALEKRNGILADRQHAYWNRSHPNHEVSVNEVLRLNEKLVGTRRVGGS